MTIDSIKKRYVFELKQLRGVFASQLEEVKEGKMNDVVSEIIPELGTLIATAIMDNTEIESSKLNESIRMFDKQTAREKINDILIRYYSNKVNEIDKLINEV